MNPHRSPLRLIVIHKHKRVQPEIQLLRHFPDIFVLGLPVRADHCKIFLPQHHMRTLPKNFCHILRIIFRCDREKHSLPLHPADLPLGILIDGALMVAAQHNSFRAVLPGNPSPERIVEIQNQYFSADAAQLSQNPPDLVRQHMQRSHIVWN